MRPKQAGFTMIELMIVVAVISILVSVAIYAYSRSVRKARSTEITAMFAELKAREEAYKNEFGRYLPVCPNPAGVPGADCAETDLWPALPGKGQAIDITVGIPARWTQLRIAPGKASLYCQYGVVAGLAGTAVPGGFPKGQLLYGAGAVPFNWFYLIAQCDWDGDPAPTANAWYWQRGDSTELGRENELR